MTILVDFPRSGEFGLIHGFIRMVSKLIYSKRNHLTSHVLFLVAKRETENEAM